MANYIGNCITPKLSSEHIAKVLVPAGGLKAGNIVFADTLANSIAGNHEVFAATQPTTATLGNTFGAIVQDALFETLDDGRRPSGQPDYTQYEWKEGGDPATVVFIDKHLTFEIGKDGCTGTSVDPTNDIGKFLIPEDGVNTLAVSATNTDIGSSLKIVSVRNFPLGGLYGGQFTTSYICVAQ